MASFPAAVKTFTTKSDGAGNTISASHVNDLQDEVNAVEDGYLNGTARLNSSGSTMTTLSVTGAAGSTMASVGLTSTSPSPPSSNRVYQNSIIRAWASCSSTPTFLGRFNMSSATLVSTLFNLAFATPMESSGYAVIATPTGSVGFAFTIANKNTTGFQVITFPTDSTTYNPQASLFNVMVVGP